jgi:hypothetical protein
MPLRLISLKRYSTILSCIILCCKLGEGVYSVVTAIPTIRNIYKHITNILLIKGPRREEHDKPAAFYLWPINNNLKGIQSLRLIFFYIESCQYSMFYTNCS